MMSKGKFYIKVTDSSGAEWITCARNTIEKIHAVYQEKLEEQRQNRERFGDSIVTSNYTYDIIEATWHKI